MYRPARIAVVLLLALALLAACGGSPAAQPTTAPAPTDAPAPTAAAAPTAGAAAHYPVTIATCEGEETFTEPPGRVFVDYQPQVELLLRLGLGDRIAAYTGVGEVPIAADVAQAFAEQVEPKTRYEQFPTREVALSAGYDLAIIAFPEYVLDPSQGRATRAEWQQAGTPVYDSKADCAGAGAAGKTLEASFTQIRDLGQIFNVEERAEALVAEMQATLDDVATRVAGRPTPRIAILDYIDEQGVPSFYAAGLYTDLITRAGGANVFADQAEQYVAISPEVVADRPVDVLAVMEWAGGISAAEKAAFYFETFPNAPASQQRRFVVLTNMDLNAGSGNANAVAKMARALHPEAFEGAATAARTQYPVTVENCGQQLTIPGRPQRAIVSWGGQAAYLLALGVEESIIGMYYRFPDEENRLVPPDLKAGYLAIPVIGGSDGTPPGREVPIALTPDFFYSDNPSDFADGRATREDFAAAGATVFSSVYGCTDPAQQTLALMFEEIRTLGVIFDAQAEAEALVARLQRELAAVEAKIAGRAPVRALLLEGSAETLYTAGNGLVTDIFARAGAENIFDGASYDAPPSREVLATAAPDVVIVWDTNVPDLRPIAREVFATAPAVANDRIVQVRYIGGIGLRAPEFAEALARAFHPEAFE